VELEGGTSNEFIQSEVSSAFSVMFFKVWYRWGHTTHDVDVVQVGVTS
jgi:hypothetical protein